MRKGLSEILRFAVVGFGNFVIIMLVAWLLADVAGAHYLVANVCAYALALANNFYWNRVWVFRSSSGCVGRQAAMFLAAYACAYAVQVAVVFALVEWGGLDDTLAQFLGLFPFGAVNFLMNQRLTFRR